jgi:hypothetical protein
MCIFIRQRVNLIEILMRGMPYNGTAVVVVSVTREAIRLIVPIVSKE